MRGGGRKKEKKWEREEVKTNREDGVGQEEEGKQNEGKMRR